MQKQKNAATAGYSTSDSIAANFDSLPDSAFLREWQLVQSPKRPETPAPLPFSAPTLWRKVKAGTFPKPIKLSERITAWKVGDVRAWIAGHCATQRGEAHQ
ncbi:AlpA family transcriptional regulator [Acidovorax sp. SRB_14]|uniref:helix-turn-helix transcriptional regulator n=1 Tax=Acidovorax sp. SRB_14 TaxID=1962699 RepID=UPI001566FEA2|nr:AlpA family phage regulatory protein [Acidovorax sp. SRB_14]